MGARIMDFEIPDVPEIFTVSVSECVRAFQLGMQVLIPVANRVGLTWTAASTHDDWEFLIDALFTVTVLNPIKQVVERVGAPYPLAKYDFDYRDYRELSWIEIHDGDEEKEGSRRLVRFESTSQPFDTQQGVLLRLSDGAIIEPLGYSSVSAAEDKYRVRLRFPDGTNSTVEQLVLDH